MNDTSRNRVWRSPACRFGALFARIFSQRLAGQCRMVSLAISGSQGRYKVLKIKRLRVFQECQRLGVLVAGTLLAEIGKFWAFCRRLRAPAQHAGGFDCI